MSIAPPPKPGQVPVNADLTAQALNVGSKPAGAAPTTARDNLKVQTKKPVLPST